MRIRTLLNQVHKLKSFSYHPGMGMSVFFWYVVRRVNCKTCGVKVESLPWCEGKHQLTTTYRLFLARSAKRLTWKEVAEVFHTSLESVYRSICYVVEYSLVIASSSGIE